VLVNDISQPWYADALAGLAGVLHDAGLDLLLADGRMNGATDHSLTRMFLEMDIDGLVLTGSTPVTDHIVRLTASVPTVALGNRDLPQVCTVANDDVRGAGLAVEHLLSLGHRRIAHLGNSDERVLALRGQTYRQVMGEHGLTGEVRVVEAPVSVEAARRETRALLAGSRPPTAVFAVNDVMCLGAYSAAADLGVAVPAALSLVGYDNTFLADLGMVQLTTVDGAGFEVGVQAGRTLNALLAGQRPPPLTLIEPHLVVRASTGPPPG
jgi:DNA-binding LacI/PurR family transcriptional regulator